MDYYFDGIANYLDDRCGPLFQEFFTRQSEFSAQLQRIVAQPHKIVYESLKSWYF